MDSDLVLDFEFDIHYLDFWIGLFIHFKIVISSNSSQQIILLPGVK